MTQIKKVSPYIERMFSKDEILKILCRNCKQRYYMEDLGAGWYTPSDGGKSVKFYRWKVNGVVSQFSESRYPPCPFCGSRSIDIISNISKYMGVGCPRCHYGWDAHTLSKRLCCPRCNHNFYPHESTLKDREAIKKIIVAVKKCLRRKKTWDISIPALQKYVIRQNKLYTPDRFRNALDKMVEKGEGMYDNDYPEKPKFIVFDDEGDPEPEEKISIDPDSTQK